MKRLFFILLISGIISMNAVEKPSSPKGREGKTVYLPIKSPIDTAQERSIQQKDQNTTRVGGMQ